MRYLEKSNPQRKKVEWRLAGVVGRWERQAVVQ